MSKSLKLKNNNYLDSTSIVHNQKLLSNILDNMNEQIINALPFKVTFGSKVVTTNGTSYKLFSMGQLNDIFNVDNCGATRIAAFVTNGDGNAQPAHFDGTTIQGTDLFVVFNRAISGSTRINYVIFYFK